MTDTVHVCKELAFNKAVWGNIFFAIDVIKHIKLGWVLTGANLNDFRPITYCPYCGVKLP